MNSEIAITRGILIINPIGNPRLLGAWGPV